MALVSWQSHRSRFRSAVFGENPKSCLLRQETRLLHNRKECPLCGEHNRQNRSGSHDYENGLNLNFRALQPKMNGGKVSWLKLPSFGDRP